MTTFRWNGHGTGFVLWDDPANWLPNGIPGVGSAVGADVLINSPVLAELYNAGTVATSVHNLQVMGLSPRAVAEFSNSRGTLDITGAMTLTNAIYFEEDSSVIGVVGNPGTAVALLAQNATINVDQGSMTIHGMVDAVASRIEVGRSATATFIADNVLDQGSVWTLDQGAAVSVTGTLHGIGDTFNLSGTTFSELSFGNQGTEFTGDIKLGGTAGTIDLTKVAWNPANTIIGASGGPWFVQSASLAPIFIFDTIDLPAGTPLTLVLSPDGHGGTDVGLGSALPAPVPFQWVGANASPTSGGAWEDPANWSPVVPIFPGPAQPIIGVGTLANADVTIVRPASVPPGQSPGGPVISAALPPLDLHDMLLAGAADGETETLRNNGNVTINGTLTVNAFGDFANQGTLVVGALQTVADTTVQLGDAGTLSVSATGALTPAVLTVVGQIHAGASAIDVGYRGTLIANGATLNYGVQNILVGTVYHSGAAVTIENGGTLTFTGSVAADPYVYHNATFVDGSVFTFNDVWTSPTLAAPTTPTKLILANQGASFAPIISNFGTRDVIDLPSLTYASGEQLINTGGSAWAIENAAGTTLLTFAGIDLAPGANEPVLAHDGSGGTQIVVPGTYTWTGVNAVGGSGSWNDTGNWSPSGVPGLGVADDVVITKPGYTIGLGSGIPALSVHNLTLSGDPTATSSAGATSNTLADGRGLTVTGTLSVGPWGAYSETANSVIGTTASATSVVLADHSTINIESSIFAPPPNRASLIIHGMIQSNGAFFNVRGATLTADGLVGYDNFNIFDGGTITISGAATGSGTFFFADQYAPTDPTPGGTLVLGAQGTVLAHSIYGFRAKDVIDLTHLGYAAGDSISGTDGGAWTIKDGLGTTLFTFDQMTLGNIALQPDGQGGTEIVGQGHAIQGYISGATVFADTNGNGVLDPGEASTTTNATGGFALLGGTGPLVAFGGTDTSTNLPFTGRLTAPSGSTVVTPLTTLVQALTTGANPLSVTAAEQAVLTTLGLSLPGGADLDHFDSIAGLLAGASGAAAAYAADTQVYDTVRMAAAALGDGANAQADVFAALANVIKAAPSTPLDLTSATTVGGIVTDALALDPSLPAPTSAQIGQIATVIAASNALSAQGAAAGIPTDAYKQISAVAHVAQGDATTALKTLANLDTTVTSFTGTPLSQAVTAAEAGVSVPCFCTGTMIRTPDGERPVETLRAGDSVLTAAGAARRITWIGAGRVLVTPARRTAATPVIIRKGALADNVPTRDLRVTKGHSLFLDGVLIPAEFLVNHRSILWDDQAKVVEFYHIELETHDLLLANGAPAESYRDDGNRWLFQNGNSGWGMAPKPPCAPVLRA